MKTILFILPNLNQGGAERVITILCNELDRKKFCPKLILFEKKGHYLNYLKEDVEIIELKTSRIRYSIFKIIPLIRKLKPDIVFTGWGEISAFLSPLIPFFTKTKFIARETNVVSKHVKRKEILFFYKFYNNFNQIIAQSDDMKIDLVDNFRINENKIIKINNPVDFDLINEMKLKPMGINFDSNTKNLIAIGNLSERKGFDLLLKVMKHLENESIHLFILGDGVLREQLLLIKNELNLKNVTFQGKVPNPFSYLYSSDLFILSSRYEGFPNVLLEAGACGTYSLSNNCPGGINEIIQEGINGEIYSIEQSKEFADKIIDALEKNHSRREIEHSIQSRFSKEIIVDKYEAIFEKL